MILQNLANSSYFKITGPLTFIQGSSANTVARNVLCSCTLLILIRTYSFKSAGVVTEVSPLHKHRTGVTVRSRPWRMALTERSLSLGMCCCSQPDCSANCGRRERAGEGKEGRKLSPPLSTVQMFESTVSLQKQGNTETRTFLKSCNQGESYCYLT